MRVIKNEGEITKRGVTSSNQLLIFELILELVFLFEWLIITNGMKNKPNY